MLVEEQAALRRIATLAARGAPPEDVFAAAVEEVGRLLRVDLVSMARYEADRTMRFLTSWGAPGPFVPIGRRLPLGGKNLNTIVYDTGRPARIDSYDDVSGAIGDAVREGGVRAAAGAPIVVDGRVWGMMAAGSSGIDPLPAGTEARLASFTELLATAITSAESRGALARLADEQAALRRVATLVARGVPPDESFSAVADEIARLLAVELVALSRYEPDDTTTTVATSGRPADRAPLCSTVEAPIIVDGRRWGLITASASWELPADIEARLASFTELVAMAIANAAARAEVGRLAEEQAALRRVATLVARGVPQADLFGAVTAEAGRLMGADLAGMLRYEPDATVTSVAAWSAAGAHPERLDRWPTEAGDPATLIATTRRPARVEDWSDVPGPIAAFVRDMGVTSSVGSPILVEGNLWGALAVHTRQPEPLPADAEVRLESFTELVATAISNAEAWTEVAASRARIAEAAVEERRRVARDLHDGAQQRMVHTVITLKQAQRALRDDAADASERLAEALGHAERATVELRELAHGILPAALTNGGLDAGVEALASRMPIAVENRVTVRRLPAPVEATAYFVVAEALTNVAKHAHARRATVTAGVADGSLRVQVRDDGVGGARPDGSGLLGLADRVAALGGELRVERPADGGTLVAAAIPLQGRPVSAR